MAVHCIVGSSCLSRNCDNDSDIQICLPELDFAADRCFNQTNSFPGTARSSQSRDFLYSEGNLVEIQNGNSVTSLTYTDGLLTNYQFTDIAYEEFSSYTYDGSGRLIGVNGENTLFVDDDCDMAFLDAEDPNRGQNLTLTYANNRISSIDSSDNVVKQSYEYNTAGLVTRITGTYACSGSDFISEITLEFFYDSNSLPSRSVITSPEYIDESVATRDETGRVIKTVATEINRFDNSVEAMTTQNISYNEQGLPLSIATSTQPSSSFFPDYTSTINYEEQSCRVAYSANPLKLVSTGAIINQTLTLDDPATCLYPLDQGDFN